MVEELALTDIELKEIHNLEFIADAEDKDGKKRKIGFSRGKFVIMNVEGSKSKEVTIEIGPSFYETLKQQALKGDYGSAKEFVQALEREAKPIKY